MFASLERIYEIYLEHPVISTDSRNVPEGSVFFAIKGDRFDGNEFASDALERGASRVIIDEPDHWSDDRCILVRNTLATLQDLAHFHRLQTKIPVIAITGSNGKTTTKELISAVLRKKYQITYTEGNLNNHIGVPLSLLRIRQTDQVAVIEMGANHRGEIGFLCEIACPDFGIITNAGKAHLEGFGGTEGVICAKTELYRFLERNNGKVFVNYTDSILMEDSARLDRITYGTDERATVSGRIIPSGSFVCTEIRSGDGPPFTVLSNLFGEYNALNILAAACIGDYFHVTGEDIRSAIESYQPANNRSQVKTTDKNTLILDSYNANPSSMEAVLRFFAGSSYENRTVILGDMLELGEESDDEHLNILKLIEDLNFGEVYLVGPSFTRLNKRRDFTCFNDSGLAKLWFSHHPLNGRTILLKGSNGIKLEKIIEAL